MTRGVVTVTPATPLADALALLTNNRFSALPVTDDGGRLLGIVTTLDLLRAEVEGRTGARVAEFMTREVMTVGPDTLVGIVAHRMRR